MDQNINIFIGWQAYVVCFVLENTVDVVVHCIHLAFIRFATTATAATAATAKKYYTATAKIKVLFRGANVKVTGTPEAALFGVSPRSIEQISKMLALRGSRENQLLLLSLK